MPGPTRRDRVYAVTAGFLGWTACFETATILALAALLLSGSEQKGKHFMEEVVS